MADLGRFLMRPASYDDGLRFGDPNARWGNPGYVLEPGDPDRSDSKGFRHLVTDTTPNYTDTEPFPTAKAIWTYKAVFFVDDAPVGQWSQPVSVTVGG